MTPPFHLRSQPVQSERIELAVAEARGPVGVGHVGSAGRYQAYTVRRGSLLWSPA